MKNNKTIEKQLENNITAFHRKIMDGFKREALELDVNHSQLETMRYVFEKGSPTMKEISKYLHITPPSTTTIIESLCAKGLLKREQDKNDNRVTRILITQKTIKFFSSLKDKKFTIVKDMFKTLNEVDKKELVRILSIITK